MRNEVRNLFNAAVVLYGIGTEVERERQILVLDDAIGAGDVCPHPERRMQTGGICAMLDARGMVDITDGKQGEPLKGNLREVRPLRPGAAMRVEPQAPADDMMAAREKAADILIEGTRDMEHAAPAKDDDILRLDLIELNKVDVMPQDIVLAEVREIIQQRAAIPIAAVLPVQAIDEMDFPRHGSSSSISSTPARTAAGAMPYMQGGSFSSRQHR